MKNKLTEIVFILDMSGSMYGLEADTIGGYNSTLAKQRGESGEAVVSTVLFNDTSMVVADRVPIERVRDMTTADYQTCGCTALLDAVGGAIHHIKNVHKYARKEDVPERTLFIITTDGMENASRRYSYADVKKMINKQKEKHNWEFLFLGANIDSAEMGARIGIDRDFTVDYCCDASGTEANFEAMNKAISYARCCSAPMSADWKSAVEEDKRRRK